MSNDKMQESYEHFIKSRYVTPKYDEMIASNKVWEKSPVWNDLSLRIAWNIVGRSSWSILWTPRPENYKSYIRKINCKRGLGASLRFPWVKLNEHQKIDAKIYTCRLKINVVHHIHPGIFWNNYFTLIWKYYIHILYR